MHIGQSKASGVLLSHSPLYFLTRGLFQMGWLATGLPGSICLFLQTCLLPVCWGFELRSSLVHSKYSYALSHLPWFLMTVETAKAFCLLF